jgi:hypothetical protein
MANRDGWVSDDDLSAARALSESVYGKNASSTSGLSAAFAKAQANKIFDENAAMAATTLVHLAKHAQNESVRLKAAESIINRALGTPLKASDLGGDADTLDQLFEQLGEAELADPTPTPTSQHSSDQTSVPSDFDEDADS